MADRPAWVMALACLGAAWLVAPLRLPARYLGVLLVLPMFVRQPDIPSAGSFVVTMLDVGQGLSVVIRTENHLLLYDTGPAFRSGFNAGRAIVTPYLKGKGIVFADRIVISHHSLDHIGGLDAISEELNVGEVIGMDRPCRSGDHWRWDGVDFHILHPRNGEEWSSNDSSCVLLVSNASGKLLLTGDLEEAGECALLERYGDSISSSVVQVGHHGSKTSSSTDFVAAVSPAYALVANGYRNRYGFPAAEVVKRWRNIGAKVLETASSGAVAIRFDVRNGPSKPVRERVVKNRFWR